MIKKISLSLSAFGALAAIVSCSSNPNSTGSRRAEIWQPQISMPRSVVVCRSRQCAPAKLSMSKEYIYNSLLHLLDNNTQSKALLCTADAASHVCTENYVTVPITVGVTPANMYIDDVKITDVSAALGNKSLNLVLNYNVTYNGQTPVCKPAETLVYVKNTNNIVLEDAGYSCKMTTIGNTTIKTLFAIDYIDLDYGYIGGYYSIGLSGPAYGGGSGYMMLRLPKDAYPLAPVLTSAADNKPIKAKIKTNMPAKQTSTPAKSKTKKASKAKAETYQGVQIFPIEHKKKAPETVGDGAAKETANDDAAKEQNNAKEKDSAPAKSPKNETKPSVPATTKPSAQASTNTQQAATAAKDIKPDTTKSEK